nr:hypothetical protein [Tanacetum cinerariifolium]
MEENKESESWKLRRVNHDFHAHNEECFYCYSTADPAAISKERLVGDSVFGGDSSSAGGIHPIFGGFSDRTGSDFLVGCIRTVVDPDSNLQRVYVPYWNVTNGFCMDDGGVCHEMVDEFAPPPLSNFL